MGGRQWKCLLIVIGAVAATYGRAPLQGLGTLATKPRWLHFVMPWATTTSTPPGPRAPRCPPRRRSPTPSAVTANANDPPAAGPRSPPPSATSCGYLNHVYTKLELTSRVQLAEEPARHARKPRRARRKTKHPDGKGIRNGITVHPVIFCGSLETRSLANRLQHADWYVSCGHKYISSMVALRRRRLNRGSLRVGLLGATWPNQPHRGFQPTEGSDQDLVGSHRRG
jgi:hypothetical protein